MVKTSKEFKKGVFIVALFAVASLCAWPFTSWWVPAVVCGSLLTIIVVVTSINAIAGHAEPLKRTLHQIYEAIALAGDTIRF